MNKLKIQQVPTCFGKHYSANAIECEGRTNLREPCAIREACRAKCQAREKTATTALHKIVIETIEGMKPKTAKGGT